MIDWDWITTSSTTLLMVLLSGIGIYIALLVLTRLAGLRSFSKMSSFDFAITVAFGSVIATTLLTKDPPLLAGAFGLLVLYGIQYLVSKSRRLSAAVEHLVDNKPLLVMTEDQVFLDRLDQVRMTEDDLRSKLRLAGITHPKHVLAVIVETTGDVSVLKQDEEVSAWIFKGVDGTEDLPIG